jgi:hypothetical protein
MVTKQQLIEFWFDMALHLQVMSVRCFHILEYLLDERGFPKTHTTFRHSAGNFHGAQGRCRDILECQHKAPVIDS